MSSKAEQARQLFLEGYNCSQAVFGAFCEDYGIDKELGLRISSGFGGGVARRREVCGAVSGAVMVLSMELGYADADAEKKKHLYEQVRKVLGEFEQEVGSIVCRELLGLSEKTSAPAPEARTAEYYSKRPCAELVYLAAKCTEDYLREHKSI